MAHLTTYGSYKGYGDYAQADLHYSQSVRVGDIIEISGQGTSETFLLLVAPGL